SVFGPVLLSALRRLASICRNEVMACAAVDSFLASMSGSMTVPAWALLGCFRCGCSAIDPRELPQFERERYRIDGELSPPCRLVTLAVKITVMDATQWDCEFVTDTAPHRIRLDKPKMMRVRRCPAAHDAWLPRNELSMLLVAQVNRFG